MPGRVHLAVSIFGLKPNFFLFSLRKKWDKEPSETGEDMSLMRRRTSIKDILQQEIKSGKSWLPTNVYEKVQLKEGFLNKEKARKELGTML